MTRYMLAVAALAVFANFASGAQPRSNVRIGIGIGFPVYPHYHYGPVYSPYYRPYPVYVAPPPIYYAPPPVVVQQAPVVYQAAPAPVPVPTVRPAVSNAGGYQEPPRMIEVSNGDASKYIQQLFDQQENVRANAAIELGRMKAAQALDPICTLLNTDRSAMVRETAARALGLIADARALSALQNAAQGNSDRDVRRSAQFAAEVIRGNPR